MFRKIKFMIDRLILRIQNPGKRKCFFIMVSESEKKLSVLEKQYMQAKKYLGISIEDFYVSKCHLMSTIKFLNFITEPTKDEQLDIASNTVSMQMGISKEEAIKIIQHICTRHDVNIKLVMSRCYYKLNDSEIEVALKNVPIRINSVEKFLNEEPDINNKQEAETILKSYAEKFDIKKSEVYKRGYFHRTEEEIWADIAARERKEYRKLKKEAEKYSVTPVEYLYFEKREILKHGEIPGKYREFGYGLMPAGAWETFAHLSDRWYLQSKYNTDKDEVETLLDKGLFAKKFRNYLGRQIWINDENASFDEFREFVESSKHNKLFIKPRRESRGNGIETVKINEWKIEDLFEKVMNKGPAVTEHLIVQHPEMGCFGGGCVNSIRVVTVFRNGECNFLYAVIRIGKGDTIDNFSKGGILARVDCDTGVICTPGYTKYGEELMNDPQSGHPLKNSIIPFWQETRKMICNAAAELEHVGFVGWDVSISEEGPILIEGNDNPQINLLDYIGTNKVKGYRDVILPWLDEA